MPSPYNHGRETALPSPNFDNHGRDTALPSPNFDNHGRDTALPSPNFGLKHKKIPHLGDFIQRYYIALTSGIKHLSESQPAGPESIISPKS